MGAAARSAFSLQHPSDLRTPTGTKPIVAEKKCEWKRGDGARTFESGSWAEAACHSLVSEDMASRPPVQATLWLATLGLDWARPRCGDSSATREWQAMNEFT